MKKNVIILSLTLFLLIFNGCSIKWTDAIKLGKIQHTGEFYETIHTEVNTGLIIIPIKINDKTFRFLFDSGAPFSISEGLQNEYKFNIISKGHIVDSDKNRKKVNYVQLESLKIGNTTFMNQTAFVTNFKSNSILQCLNIDGIVGSNLMRHCNWIIDYPNKNISILNRTSSKVLDNSLTIPFHTDNQYNILVDISIGEVTIRNITIDYGYNGSLSLPMNVYEALKQKNAIGETFIEEGIKQSGIIGKPVKFSRKITFVDSVKFGNIVIDNVELKSGSSGLIGKKILSKFIVTIDWNKMNLYLQAITPVDVENETFGFSLGYSPHKGLIIQSIIKNSIADKNKLKPNMQILKIDSLDFKTKHNYCDYVALMNNEPSKLFIQLVDNNGIIRDINITKTGLEK